MGAQQRIRIVPWRMPQVETMFMGLLQAAGLLRGCFPLQEVGVLTDRAAILWGLGYLDLSR